MSLYVRSIKYEALFMAIILMRRRVKIIKRIPAAEIFSEEKLMKTKIAKCETSAAKGLFPARRFCPAC